MSFRRKTWRNTGNKVIVRHFPDRDSGTSFEEKKGWPIYDGPAVEVEWKGKLYFLSFEKGKENFSVYKIEKENGDLGEKLLSVSLEK